MKHQCAFTLFECLIAIALISIMTVFSLPTLKNIMDNNEEKILQQTIVESIQFAQDQAISQSHTVNLKLNNKNEMIISTTRELTVRKLKLSNGNLQIRSFPYYRDYLRFTPSDNDNGTITYSKNNRVVWSIVLSATGRIRTTN